MSYSVLHNAMRAQSSRCLYHICVRSAHYIRLLIFIKSIASRLTSDLDGAGNYPINNI